MIYWQAEEIKTTALEVRPRSRRFSSAHGSYTRIRVKICVPACYRQAPVISQLITNYHLVVNITGAHLRGDRAQAGWFDLELQGTPLQLNHALTHLQELGINIQGKPNPDGDAW